MGEQFLMEDIVGGLLILGLIYIWVLTSCLLVPEGLL